MPKKPEPSIVEPEISDVEGDDEGELEIVEEIAPIKGLKKNGQPRKQMSPEVKAKNAENLKIAREKAALLKKSHTATTAKPPPAPAPAIPPLPPPRVPPVPVPTAYTEQEVAKLKAQKLMFEKQQKKEALLMAAIFN